MKAFPYLLNKKRFSWKEWNGKVWMRLGFGLFFIHILLSYGYKFDSEKPSRLLVNNKHSYQNFNARNLQNFSKFELDAKENNKLYLDFWNLSKSYICLKFKRFIRSDEKLLRLIINIAIPDLLIVGQLHLSNRLMMNLIVLSISMFSDIRHLWFFIFQPTRSLMKNFENYYPRQSNLLHAHLLVLVIIGN